ncbi:hypothetical protein THAOC_01791, partial [Thalassiosira oceanica]
MQTSKFNNDIMPFQVTFRGLQLVSQLYLPPKWAWTAVISSGNYDEIVITIPLQYHCMISSLSFPILGRQRLGQPNLPALDIKSQLEKHRAARGQSAVIAISTTTRVRTKRRNPPETTNFVLEVQSFDPPPVSAASKPKPGRAPLRSLRLRPRASKFP